MLIKYLAHSSFLITSRDGVKIITDPYNAGDGLNYNPVNESADIVTISHGHGDHNNARAVKGSPQVLTQAGTQTVKDITFKAVKVFHDEAGGKKRGANLLFRFMVDNLALCHMGDLGHTLDPAQLSELGKVDVIFIPVGGFFTIDSVEAAAVITSLRPRVVFPMHYKTARSEYPIAGVDEFLKGKKNVRRLDSSEIELSRAALPEKMEIIVPVPAN
ncbi:MAG: MBL fold metallo-hydrolase [Dehalococcoidales bacterium]|nr:MBL fold metallo-hydrolase [Dehalococcoidales bacterium]